MKVIVENEIISFLLPKFKANGYNFRKKDLEFFRVTQEGNTSAVGIGLLPASRHSFYKLVVSAHIRIQLIEKIYNKYLPCLRPPEYKHHYTLNINCDNLFRDRSISKSFEVSSNSALADVSENLWKAITSEVLPFLEKYCDREQLVTNLRSDNYKDWVISDRMVRYCILLSDKVLTNDKDGFEKYAAEWLDYCNTSSGQYLLQAAKSVIVGIRAEYFSSQGTVCQE